MSVGRLLHNSTHDVVVIGAGVVGASTAYHLAHRGVKPLVLERHKPTSGTTWHSAGLFVSARADITDFKITRRTKILAQDVLEGETGVSPGFTTNGTLALAPSQARLNELKRLAGIAIGLGVNDISVIEDRAELKRLNPMLDTSGLLGGLHCPSDGSVDPTGLTNAYIKGASLKGASFVEDCPVARILVEANRVKGVLTKHGDMIKTDKVVLATGSWSSTLAHQLGVSLPMRSNKHAYVVTEPIRSLENMSVPNVKLSEDGFYTRVSGQSIILGAFEANPTFVEVVDPDLRFGLYDLDWSVFGPYIEAHQRLMPELKEVGLKTEICGPETFTPDGKPLFGETPEIDGLFVNCGQNSRGIQSSGGLGQEMANLLVDNATSLDMSAYDVARFPEDADNDNTWLTSTTQETQARYYWIGHPNGGQRFAGRKSFESPFQDILAGKGAYFWSDGGFEVPRFFISGSDLTIPDYDYYGYYGHKKIDASYKTVYEEHSRWIYSDRIIQALKWEEDLAKNGIAFVDKSARTKISVSGADSERFCDALSNWTVTKLGSDEFWVEGPNFQSRRLILKSLKTLSARFNVEIEDVSKNFGVLALVGKEEKVQIFLQAIQENGEVRKNGNELILSAKVCSEFLEKFKDINFIGSETVHNLEMAKTAQFSASGAKTPIFGLEPIFDEEKVVGRVVKVGRSWTQDKLFITTSNDNILKNRDYYVDAFGSRVKLE